jgi:hypothetical protein
MSPSVVWQGEPGHRDFRLGPDWSDGQGWRSDYRITARGGDGFQRHAAGSLHGPFVVLFQEDGAHERDDRLVVGEDADDFGARLNVAPQTIRLTNAISHLFFNCLYSRAGAELRLDAGA